MPSGPCLCGPCLRGGPPQPHFSVTVPPPIGRTHNEQACREHASAGPILAAGRHNPVRFGWSMPRARGGLSPYKRSWQKRELGEPPNTPIQQRSAEIGSCKVRLLATRPERFSNSSIRWCSKVAKSDFRPLPSVPRLGGKETMKRTVYN